MHRHVTFAIVAVALAAALLAVCVDAHSSVKTMKHTEFHEQLAHDHIHRQHRRAGGVPHGDRHERALEHHEIQQAEHEALHADDGGHRYFSPNPRHRVGPQYGAEERISHKPRRRHGANGEPIPHEIRDETLHRMRHH